MNEDHSQQDQQSAKANVQQSHPLHGVGLEEMLGELVRQYGWPILAEQIPIKCFQNYPTFVSCKKFLKKTAWARERLEAFYLYKYKSLPRPSDDQHTLPPRERLIDATQIGEPIKIVLGEAEFFDDPVSGPVFPSRKSVESTRAQTVRDQAPVARTDSDTPPKSAVDPWAKWK